MKNQFKINLPGFTAENSAYKAIGYFLSEAGRSYGSGKNDNQVYLQRPNKENKPGDKCSASAGDVTINSGTYNSKGQCCSPKFIRSDGTWFQNCIDCDNDFNGVSHCSDAKTIQDHFLLLPGRDYFIYNVQTNDSLFPIIQNLTASK